MKHWFFIFLFFHGFVSFAQNQRYLPFVFGVDYNLTGNLKSNFESQFPSFNSELQGISLYARVNNLIIPAFELKILTPNDLNTNVDIKYHIGFNLCFGGMIRRHKRLSFPIQISMGPGTTVRRRDTSLSAVSYGTKIGLNYYVTQKVGVALMYSYAISENYNYYDLSCGIYYSYLEHGKRSKSGIKSTF